MVTGDHPRTAAAIAREVGLLTPARHRASTGATLPAGRRGARPRCSTAPDGVVVARVTPADKLRIARALADAATSWR